MAKLHQNITKVRKYVEPHLLMAEKTDKEKADKIYDTAHPLGTKAVETRQMTKDAEAALAEQKEEKIMPIADEDAVARARRRAQQKRRSQGRSSTILGGDAETLG